MRISITGANGFIGRRLTQFLGEQGHEIRVLSRRADSVFSEGVLQYRGDLSSPESTFGSFLEGTDVVFHCAGEIQNESAMRTVHVDGTRRLLQAAREQSAKSGKAIHWVQLSSVGAYGPPGRASMERIVTELTPTNPKGEYEVTKTAADELVVKACDSDQFTFCIVRPSNVFAADMPNQSLRALGKAISKRLFFYIGQPGAVATYVHVNDVVETLVSCGTDHRAKGKIFNVSNDCLFEDFIGGIAAAVGVSPPTMRLPESVVRSLVWAVTKAIPIPLTQERVDALVTRTRYPYLKLEKELGVVPRAAVPHAIGEVFRRATQ